MSNFPYSGIHEYLDECADMSATPLTDEQIIQFKQEYRKKYLAFKKKEHRKSHRTISISMSKEDYLILQSLAKKQGLKMRDYFFMKLFGKEGSYAVKKALLPKVLTLVDDVEFAIYEKGTLHLPKTLDILMHIKNLLL